MIDIILDLETLSTESNAAILQIGAVALNKDLKVVGEFDVSFGLTNSKSAAAAFGLDISDSTLQWWATQPNKVSVFSGNNERYANGLHKFHEWVKQLREENSDEEVRMWGRGADFDCVILKNSLSKVGIVNTWRYSNNRCLRTLNELAGLNVMKYPRLPTEEAHTAIGDARYQTRLFILAKELLR